MGSTFLISPSGWVSFSSYWCSVLLGKPASDVFACPSVFSTNSFPPFYRDLLVAWKEVDGYDMEPAADSDSIANVSSLGAPQDRSVSDADNQWNRNEVNLTRLERDFFFREMSYQIDRNLCTFVVMSVWSLRMCWSLLGELV